MVLMSKMNPVHTFPPYFSKIYSNIILPSMPSLPSSVFPSGFPTKILYTFVVFPMYATQPTHLILLDLITIIILEYK